MSSQLASIVPCATLTDEVFPFNQTHFQEIRQYQQNDLGFLSSPPVRALIDVTDTVGGTATGITAGVGGIAKGVSGAGFGLAGRLTQGLPGSGMFGKVGQGASGVIDTTTNVAEHLVDPTRVVRDHAKYSNYIHDNLPGAIADVDEKIHKFASEMGNQSQELYENIPTKGIQILTGSEGRLADVLKALTKLIDVLTHNNVQGELKIGQDKYRGIHTPGGLPKSYLGEIDERLPKVVQTVQEVKAAFETINANLGQAKNMINNGVTDSNQIFAEQQKDVEASWQKFEVQRKTMTYLPYKY